MISPADAARGLMARGWAVFPVDGKVPCTEHGVLDATTDQSMVAVWWEGPGPGRGLALATGEPSGVWALDLDGSEGVEAAVQLQEEHAAFPSTVTSRTRNGYHLIFRMPETGDVRNSAGKVAPGIDVRGTGGYIVVPPSPHPEGGRYTWVPGRSPDDLHPATAPAWLLRLVRPRTRTAVPVPPPPSSEPHDSRYIQAAIESECTDLARTPKGGRNHRLNVAAFSLARFVAAGEAEAGPIVRELRHAAATAGLPEHEINRTVKSAFEARGAPI